MDAVYSWTISDGILLYYDIPISFTLKYTKAAV